MIVERSDGYSLWELADRQPEATGTEQVERARNVQEALEMVTTPGFDPAQVTVVEDSDVFGAVSEAQRWDARIVGRSPTVLRIRLEPTNGGVLTIRSAFDPGWRAKVDGQDARTLPVDGFLQGVIVARDSSREVVLTYHDDPVMIGLALGAAVWGALLAAPLLALASQRRAARGRDSPGRWAPRRPTRSHSRTPAA
jgi:hypothetical protein